ncbi:hypothetical protein [Kaistia terrae]|uniref:Core-binding (CB) domain-containing protein n=1 Tax=Kaistia terrae TaxID=537017 RepID=A0ABW0PYA7_9HYPH|nr:hypothetical protein [Kaistia terrae]MCX5580888.1 hypothetical protein [Kaistia terrae]
MRHTVCKAAVRGSNAASWNHARPLPAFYSVAAKGADPANKSTAKAALTVKALFEEFERLHIAPKLKPNTTASYRSAFQVHIDPIVGRKRAADVQPADLLRYQAKLDGHRASANRVLAVVSAMYSWAGEHAFIAEGTNPAAKVTRFANKKRERPLSLEELESLGAALTEGENVGIPCARSEQKGPSTHRRQKIVASSSTENLPGRFVS